MQDSLVEYCGDQESCVNGLHNLTTLGGELPYQQDFIIFDADCIEGTCGLGPAGGGASPAPALAPPPPPTLPNVASSTPSISYPPPHPNACLPRPPPPPPATNTGLGKTGSESGGNSAAPYFIIGVLLLVAGSACCAHIARVMCTRTKVGQLELSANLVRTPHSCALVANDPHCEIRSLHAQVSTVFVVLVTDVTQCWRACTERCGESPVKDRASDREHR
eukprot:SAG11_NODE_2144_length_3754_cov_2.328591_2_plen_220_part_00